ncbi:MAG: hypothetical protein IT236_17235 [Bacteroidia bacterium]|nr:hypothetical protein [Bacteroidia bacterium]
MLTTAKYIDKYGEEITSIASDGNMLKIMIRDVCFEGNSFEYLSPKTNSIEELKNKFDFYCDDCLCSCEFDLSKPIEILKGKEALNGLLTINILLGEPTGNANDELANIKTQIFLDFENEHFVTKQYNYPAGGAIGDVETALFELKDQLPSGYTLKCCFFCLYSNYSPYGKKYFGDMQCYRNLKSKFSSPKELNESQYWHNHHPERCVQETYLCEDYDEKPSFMENRRSGE